MNRRQPRWRGARAVRTAGALLLALSVAACSPAEGYQIGPTSSDAAPEQPTEPSEKPGFTGVRSHMNDPGNGVRFGAAGTYVADAEGVLRRRLERLDVKDDRAALRLLESYGAAFPPVSRPALEDFAVRLLDALKDPRSPVRRGATAVLARIDRQSFKGDPFTGLFVDVDPEVRREAVLGRMRHGVGTVWTHVVGLTHDPDPGVRTASATALGTVDHGEVTVRLVEMLTDRSPEVVAAAGRALERTLAGAPPQGVLDGCASDRVEVRLAAARVLGALRGTESAALLTRMMDDSNWQVRRAAIEGLIGVGGEQSRTAAWSLVGAAEHKGRSRTDRLDAIEALARTQGRPDLDRLAVLAATEADPVLRLGAARTLLAWGDLRALDVLVDLTELKPASPQEKSLAAVIRKQADHTIEEALASSRAETDGSYEPARNVVRTRTWREKLPSLKKSFAVKGVHYSPSALDDSSW